MLLFNSRALRNTKGTEMFLFEPNIKFNFKYCKIANLTTEKVYQQLFQSFVCCCMLGSKILFCIYFFLIGKFFLTLPEQKNPIFQSPKYDSLCHIV